MHLFTPRRIAGFAALAVGAALLAGCWGAKFVQMPQNSLDSSTGVDSLEVRVNRLEWRIYELSGLLKEQQEFSRRNSARQKIDIEELKDGLNAALQLLSESGSGTAGYSPPAQLRNRMIQADTSSADSTLNIAEQRDSTAGSDTVSVSVPPPDEIYSQVYMGFARMNYQNAIEDSKIFLEEYPGHPLEEKIFFIRGECFMQQDKYFDALKEFSRILNQYPDGEKVPGALLRSAIAYDEIGDRDLAAGVVRRLVRTYPDTEEASTAREKFGDMLGD